MRSFRMPIFGLMGIVLACGLALAAIKSPTYQAVSVTFTVALTILLASIVGAIFGWGYAILAFAPGAWVEIRPYLVTSRLLDSLSYRMQIRFNEVGWVGMSDATHRMDSGLEDWDLTVKGNCFQRIGHSIAAIVHGFAGGVLAVWLANRSRNRGRERGEG
jgi:hypothetical protein